MSMASTTEMPKFSWIAVLMTSAPRFKPFFILVSFGNITVLKDFMLESFSGCPEGIRDLAEIFTHERQPEIKSPIVQCQDYLKKEFTVLVKPPAVVPDDKWRIDLFSRPQLVCKPVV